MLACRSYLAQHKVVVVCSARSGTTKSNGTTNLLLKAAAEARHRPNPANTRTPGGGLTRNGSGFFSPQPAATTPKNGPSAELATLPDKLDRLRSLSSGGHSRASSPSPFVPLSSCTPTPSSLSSSLSSLPAVSAPAAAAAAQEDETPDFNRTVDQIRDDHFESARGAVKDEGLLEELLAEIERDCEGLRSFLYAAQVRRWLLSLSVFSLC